MKSINQNNWIVSKRRFVAYIDILGFKDLVLRSPHDEIYNKLKAINQLKSSIYSAQEKSLLQKHFGDSNVHIVNFSDSIFIFSDNDNLQNFEYFMHAVRYFVGSCIDSKIPIKGSIAHGIISVNINEQIYFGQPIIDAYLLEQSINQFGLVFHHSVDHYLNDRGVVYGQNSITKNYIKTSKFHFKFGLINHMFLNWFALLIKNVDEANDMDEISKEIIEKLSRFYSTCSGESRKYVDNTIEFFKTCVKEKVIYITKQTTRNEN